jgi:hypothetical protein
MDATMPEEGAHAPATGTRGPSDSGVAPYAPAYPRQDTTVAGGRGVQVGSGNVQYNTFNYLGEPPRSSLVVRPVSGDGTRPGFVGRTQELSRIRSLLAPGSARGGLIVLTAGGQAGIGRTALAVEAAADAARREWFAGGVLFVGLSRGDPDQRAGQVFAALLGALGVPPGPGGDEQARYREVMAGLARRGEAVLIVVDDVTDADTDLVAALAADGPHRLLLTARARLTRIRDVWTVPVEGLPEDDAVDLLNGALAGEYGAGRRPVDSPEHLRRVARLCDGVPEALRRAADYLARRPAESVSGLVQVLADCSDRLRAPDGGLLADQLDDAVAGIVELVADRWQLPPGRSESVRRLVGRRALLSWKLADYDGARFAIWDVTAAPGTGKTALLDALRGNLDAAGATVIFLSGEWLAEAYRRRLSSSGDPLVVELARMEFCQEAVSRIGRDVPGAGEAALAEHGFIAGGAVREALAERSPQQPGLDIRDALLPGGLDDAAQPVPVQVSEWYAGRVRMIREDLGSRVGEFLARLADRDDEGRHLAILVDNFHVIADPACREWLLDSLTSRPRSLVVVTRRPGQEIASQIATTYMLRGFTPAEVRACLIARLGQDAVSDQVVAEVIRVTDSSPLAVGTLCDALTGKKGRTMNEILAELDARPAQEPLIQQVCLIARRLVRDACQEIIGKDDAEVPVFDYLTVMRGIDGSLLARVLGGHGVDEERADALMSWLAARSFIGRYDDDEEEGFRLHEHIRQQRTAEIPGERLRRLHERAENVYRHLVSEFEAPEVESDDAHYGWLMYELPEFGRLVREWIYHAVLSQGARLRRETALSVTQFFLEAWYWWGCYVQFPLCEQLLGDFERITGERTGTDREWLAILSRFYRNYPRGWQHTADPASWDAVKDAMRALRRRAGFDVRPPRHDDVTGGTLIMLISIVEAHAHWYGRPGDPAAAARCYHSAREYVRAQVAAGYQRNAWCEPWIVFEWADMWHDFGDIGQSAMLLHELDAFAESIEDEEMIDRDLRSRVARLHGDIRRARGDYQGAIDAYAKSAMLAYVYHVWQESLDTRVTDYSLEAHVENIARVGAGLADIKRRAPRPWAEGIARMWAYFEPYRRAGDSENAEFPRLILDGQVAAGGPALPDGLLPPLPQRSDLDRWDSPYAQRIDRVIAEIGDTLMSWTSL